MEAQKNKAFEAMASTLQGPQCTVARVTNVPGMLVSLLCLGV